MKPRYLRSGANSETTYREFENKVFVQSYSFGRNSETFTYECHEGSFGGIQFSGNSLQGHIVDKSTLFEESWTSGKKGNYTYKTTAGMY